MVNEKNWHQSKTIWGVLIAFSASIASGGGFDPAEVSNKEVSDALFQVLGVLGSLMAIYGRICARETIR